MLRDGAIGRVRHVKAIFQAPHRGDPLIAWNWWSDASAGGGALGAIASHIIDSIVWLLGADATGVYCQLHTHIKKRPDAAGTLKDVTSDDESNMLLQFGDGGVAADATGLISISMTEFPKYKNRLEFYGDKGSLRIEQLGELFIARAGDDDWSEVSVDIAPEITGITDAGGFSRSFLAFAPILIEAIRRGELSIAHAATFEDGVRTQRILDAARSSNASGCISMLNF